MKRKDTVAEILLGKHLDELGLQYRREWQFHPLRRWRFDFVIGEFLINRHWEPFKKAIEIEGGIWTNGAHVRGKHYESDLRKYNEAAKLGWTVIRFTPNMIQRGESKAFLAELFGRRCCHLTRTNLGHGLRLVGALCLALSLLVGSCLYAQTNEARKCSLCGSHTWERAIFCSGGSHEAIPLEDLFTMAWILSKTLHRKEFGMWL